MRNRTSRIIINRRNGTIQFWKSWYPYMKAYPKTSRNQGRVEACVAENSSDWTMEPFKDTLTYTRRNVR